MKQIVLIILCFPLMLFAQDNLNDSLIAYYPFNGNANDESGNDYNGIVNGALLMADRFGNDSCAYLFDGIDDYIDLENTSALNVISGFSLAAWVNYTDNIGGHSVISKHINGYMNGFTLAASDNHASLTVNNNQYVITTTETYNDGNWHFFVGTYADSLMSIYVDTVLKVSDYGHYTLTNNTNIRIGKDNNLSPFNGIIDDVRIYNKTLTINEIKELYDLSAGIKPISVIFADVTVFPNPFTTTTTLSYTLEKPENVQFTIYNVQGQVVDMMQERQDKGVQKIEWNAEGLPAGMYYFRIQAGDKVGGGKMVKMD